MIFKCVRVLSDTTVLFAFFFIRDMLLYVYSTRQYCKSNKMCNTLNFHYKYNNIIIHTPNEKLNIM